MNGFLMACAVLVSGGPGLHWFTDPGPALLPPCYDYRRAAVNLIDRFLFGGVIDYNISDPGDFNLADIAIVAGSC